MLGRLRRGRTARLGPGGAPLPDYILPRGLHRIYELPRVRSALARHFNRAYYYAIWTAPDRRHWLGHETLKYPADLWAFQEIITEVRPAVVVETGTYEGGSALFFGTLLDALGAGRVISVDVSQPDSLPHHRRITYIEGSSTAAEVIESVRAEIGDESPVLVVLDSEHSRAHVLAELRAYCDLVDPGSYLIVEDTNLNGHPVMPWYGPGPAEAVEVFLAEDERFEPDPGREPKMLTQNPGGVLRRVR